MHQSALMQKQPIGSERRGGLREGHKFPVRLLVRQAPSSQWTTVQGVSKNVTPEGMRICVSKKIIVGTRCEITFLEAGGRVIPEQLTATVRNSKDSPTATGEFEIGVQFDCLVQIKQPGKL